LNRSTASACERSHIRKVIELVTALSLPAYKLFAARNVRIIVRILARAAQGLRMEATIEDRADRVLAAAEQLLAVAPDWVTFFRAILGTDGEAARQFPSREERRAFERTAAYLNISRMLVRLRERRKDRPCPDPTRVITVRLP